MGRLMDCMSPGRLVSVRGCCYEKETFALCAYAAGQTVKTRAGYPTPSRTLGKVQKMTAPVAGSSSRWSMTSIW